MNAAFPVRALAPHRHLFEAIEKNKSSKLLKERNRRDNPRPHQFRCEREYRLDVNVGIVTVYPAARSTCDSRETVRDLSIIACMNKEGCRSPGYAGAQQLVRRVAVGEEMKVEAFP